MMEIFEELKVCRGCHEDQHSEDLIVKVLGYDVSMPPILQRQTLPETTLADF